MTHQAAIALGQSLRVLALGPDEPAALVTPDVVLGDHRDLDALRRAAAGAEALTFDHEHVPAEHLEALVAEGVTVHPGPDALRHAQDKLVMRRRLTELGEPVPPFAPVESPADVESFAAEHGWPVVLKAVRGGYDGRGVWMLDSAEEAAGTVGELLDAGTPLMVEQKVALRRELAVVLARSPYGQVAVYPTVETVQVDGICTEVLAPAPGLSDEAGEATEELAIRIAAALGVVGLLAVELFETPDGRVLVNELAMRPHNSGPLGHGRRGDRAVRAAPARGPRLPAGLDGDPAPGLRHGERPRGRPRTADRTRRAAPPHPRPLPGGAGAPLRQGRAAGSQDRPREHHRRRPRRRPPPGTPGRRPSRDGRLDRRMERTLMSSEIEVADRRLSPLVGIVMGSDSDWPTMQAAAEALDEFGVPWEARVLSAHRTPRAMLEWSESAAGRGLRVVVAGAGGAAHLPGMVAAATVLPVIGVPVPLKHLDGMDSLLSIVQMPAGVPVATVSIGGARNGGLLAVRILAAADAGLAARMADFQADLRTSVAGKDEAVRKLGPAGS